MTKISFFNAQPYTNIETTLKPIFQSYTFHTDAPPYHPYVFTTSSSARTVIFTQSNPIKPQTLTTVTTKRNIILYIHTSSPPVKNKNEPTPPFRHPPPPPPPASPPPPPGPGSAAPASHACAPGCSRSARGSAGTSRQS